MGVAGGRLSMEVPVHDIVNTGEETFRAGSGVSGFINVCLTRQSASQPWGFRLQGGKDRGLPFQLLKVPLDSIASHSGAKSGDYLVKIGGHDVFHLNHEEAKDGEQAVQLADGHVQRGHHRGDHDTGHSSWKRDRPKQPLEYDWQGIRPNKIRGSLCNHGAGTGGSTSSPSPSLKLRDSPRIFSSENVTVPSKTDAITTKLPKTTKQNMFLLLILNK